MNLCKSLQRVHNPRVRNGAISYSVSATASFPGAFPRQDLTVWAFPNCASYFWVHFDGKSVAWWTNPWLVFATNLLCAMHTGAADGRIHDSPKQAKSYIRNRQGPHSLTSLACILTLTADGCSSALGKVWSAPQWRIFCYTLTVLCKEQHFLTFSQLCTCSAPFLNRARC